MFKKSIEVIGSGKELKITGWNEAPEYIKNQVKNELMRHTLKIIFVRDIIKNEKTVKVNDLNAEYHVKVTWVKVFFGAFKPVLDISASPNDLEYIRMHLCNCDKCTESLSKLFEEVPANEN